jgi:hypothetical protein
MYLRAIAIGITMTFVEIQKIFEQLFVTLSGNLNQLNSDLTPLLLY